MVSTQPEEGKTRMSQNDQYDVLKKKIRRWYLTTSRGNVKLHASIHILLLPLTVALKLSAEALK